MVFGVRERVAPLSQYTPNEMSQWKVGILRWSYATEQMSRVAREQQIVFLSTLQMDILIYQGRLKMEGGLGSDVHMDETWTMRHQSLSLDWPSG